MPKYRVKDIFGPTIQGEGSRAGTVVKFVRFSGCNRWSGMQKHKPDSICNFCDTDFLGGEKISDAEIIKRLEDLGPVKTVVLSGGEPTIQINRELIAALKYSGYKLHLETNGSNDIGELFDEFDHVTISPKQAISETNLKKAHDLKILYPYIGEGINPYGFHNFKADNRFLQPIEREGKPEESVIEELYRLSDWRLSYQIHKVIGVL